MLVFFRSTHFFVRKAEQCRVFMTLSNISTADSVDASIHVSHAPFNKETIAPLSANQSTR